MAKYYIMNSEEMAKGVSAVKARQEGCEGVTSFWWSVIGHPSNGNFALVFPDEELFLEQGQTVKILYKNPPENPTLTITTDDLVTRATLEAAGWFPLVTL